VTICHHIDEATQGAQGIPVEVRIDGAKPLSELTATVNTACDELAAGLGEAAVIFAVEPAPAGRPDWLGEIDIHDVRRWERAIQRIAQLNTISAALVSGICCGPGLEILLAADLRIATPETHLVFSAGDGHAWPGMSLYRLTQQVGTARARQVVMWRSDISADEALGWGLLDAVTSDSTAASTLVTTRAAQLSGREIAVRRQLIQEAGSAEFDTALGVHLAACDRELRRSRVDG
jgi:isomerase DpgB